MKTLLKNAREQKGLKTREVSHLLNIDQALISKFESGLRKPTKEQVVKLASLLEIDLETLMIAWLKEKIIHEIGQDKLAIKAMNLVLQEVEITNTNVKKAVSKNLQSILDEIDLLKSKLDQFRNLDNSKIEQALELRYTFESNHIEGNTLTLQETDSIINQGLTISGKSMREHLEAINHQEAIAYIKLLIAKNTALNEREVLSIHNLILRGINPENAGKYRREQVMKQSGSYMPPQSFLVSKEMEDFFIWYETNKNSLHPIVLAAEIHERIVTIHPFIDGNGRTSRLIMNLILLQNGYVITTIKGDSVNRTHYYNTLETALTKNNKEDFILFVAQTEKESLEHYLDSFGQ